MDTFRWWPTNGGRHAIPGELQPGDSGHTLCGREVTVTARWHTKSEWLWPTCEPCHTAACQRVHVLVSDTPTWG